jgi:hypothetical protein
MPDKDTAFRRGENVKIVASNRPWIDMTVPPESNDYRDVDVANIKIYDPCDRLIIDWDMCKIPDRVGWYYYDFQTTDESKAGLWRVVITFSCNSITTCSQPTTSSVTSSSSGSPGPISAVSVNYFRLLDDRLF